jgi:trimethylamine corrinoid protein
MSDRDQIIEQMRESIINADPEEATAAAEAAVAAGLDPLEALEDGFSSTIREMGEAFDRMEIFLPQLVMSADALTAGLAVLEPAIQAGGGDAHQKGRVVLGTVEGDIHDIGKTVVATMLRSAGYEVHDLGIDVQLQSFLNVAEKVGANVIAMSALLSTTMLRQKDFIEYLNTKGVRDRYFVLIGGAPVTEAWSEEIGADGFGRDAYAAVRVLDARAASEVADA